ncbi:MAG: secondary thiamine-phosphate synthase enzyme YjbQ [Hyphomicrobium sp.]|nr:secondary thiamine-phosphate synthase enzyme YjbQ [Hyphomicrobium sp.]
MRQTHDICTVEIHTPGLVEITDRISRSVENIGMSAGLVTIFCRHTSASLLIQENADPDVVRDLDAFFRRLVPEGDPLFVHTAEGPDDMPAHVKAALTQTSLTIPLLDGRLALGRWQGIYLFEHRRRPHRREIVISAIGE